MQFFDRWQKIKNISLFVFFASSTIAYDNCKNANEMEMDTYRMIDELITICSLHDRWEPVKVGFEMKRLYFLSDAFLIVDNMKN